MELSVIIVNWNSKEYLRKCLHSLYTHTKGVTFEVIVVDGASFDGCDQMLQKEFPSVTFIQSPENIGFARCNNLGAKSARGATLLFLNPDTELNSDTASVLSNRLTTLPKAGLVGCRLLNSDGSLQTSCVQSLPTVLNQTLDSEFLRAKFPRSSLWGVRSFFSGNHAPQEVEAISGACMMVRRPVYDEVGGFTERYFMYGEDLDLCCKIQRAGHRLFYLPETTVIHHGGGSTRKAPSAFANVMMRKSVHLFLSLNRGPLSALLYRLSMATTSVVRLVVILPLLAFRSKRVVQHGTGSLHKWTSILRWSVGLAA